MRKMRKLNKKVEKLQDGRDKAEQRAPEPASNENIPSNAQQSPGDKDRESSQEEILVSDSEEKANEERPKSPVQDQQWLNIVSMVMRFESYDERFSKNKVNSDSFQCLKIVYEIINLSVLTYW